MTKRLSGKVQKTPPSQVSPDRYTFIGLSETEPDLGVPATTDSVLASDTSGTRSWVTLPQKVAYHHVQNSASAVWTITHNLNFFPNVTTMDSSGSLVEGEIVHTNRNTVRVTFLAAFSGEAFLS